MKIALLGCGAMGGLVVDLASAAGHEVGAKVSSNASTKTAGELAEILKGHDVAIDFSVAGAVLGHVDACMNAGVPLVEGTTGWKEFEAEARELVKNHNGAMVYGANFSIGVNVFYRIAAHAAGLLSGTEQYEAFIEERHHSRKVDAPSGTALKLQSLMSENGKAPRSVASTRAGHIPGTHIVGFDSAADQITLTHTARSREGFALGALLAANWIVGRRGVFEFTEVIDEILTKR